MFLWVSSIICSTTFWTQSKSTFDSTPYVHIPCSFQSVLSILDKVLAEHKQRLPAVKLAHKEKKVVPTAALGD
jgi:hypothetical protein